MTAADPSSARAPASRPPLWKAWALAARPRTLPVAVAPVVVGTAAAATAGPIRWDAVAAALWAALWIQIGTNFANDVFDFERGADHPGRLGPPRAVQQGWLSPATMKRGMFAAFGLAFLVGLWLVAVGGWPLLAVGVASILSGIAYTGGPFPLAYNGLGDVFVFVFFGIVAVVCTAFVAGTGEIPAAAWWASIPVGALATAVLVVNNTRDHVTDAGAGKRTLVVRFGRRFGTLEYAGWVVLCYGAIVVGVILGALPPPTLLGLLALPLSIRLTRQVGSLEGAALNPLLGATAQSMLLVSVLLAVGLLVGR